MYEIVKKHWVAAAGFIAIALVAITPVLYFYLPLGVFLIFLHSPAYMIHQLEEHVNDRFRIFVNETLLGGREALTTADVIWINVGLVWGSNLAALYAAYLFGVGWALIAPYLVLVNAVGHIAQALVKRSYNPGVITSVLIFLPLGATTLAVTHASGLQHGFALAFALVSHVSIVATVALHLRAARRLAA